MIDMEASHGVDDNSNVGRWTQQEHDLFLQGYELYGKDWRKIAEYIGTRSNVQCRTHAQKHFKRCEGMRSRSKTPPPVHQSEKSPIAKKPAETKELPIAQVEDVRISLPTSVSPVNQVSTKTMQGLTMRPGTVGQAGPFFSSFAMFTPNPFLARAPSTLLMGNLVTATTNLRPATFPHQDMPKFYPPLGPVAQFGMVNPHLAPPRKQ